MDQTELTQFAVDCSLATANFPMSRIIELFERADVVDDAKDVKSKSGQKAGAGTKSDRSAVASATALTMQQSELTDLALDCSLATADFPMERVVQVFESADAVKDPAALKKGATADGNLELQEFLEAVAKLAFHRVQGFRQDAPARVPGHHAQGQPAAQREARRARGDEEAALRRPEGDGGHPQE
jgi:hypothetical protein